MSDSVRNKTIRLAASLPKGSEARKGLLKILVESKTKTAAPRGDFDLRPMSIGGYGSAVQQAFRSNSQSALTKLEAADIPDFDPLEAEVQILKKAMELMATGSRLSGLQGKMPRGLSRRIRMAIADAEKLAAAVEDAEGVYDTYQRHYR